MYGKRHSVIRQPPNPTLFSGPIECRIREVSLHMFHVPDSILVLQGNTDSEGIIMHVIVHVTRMVRTVRTVDGYGERTTVDGWIWREDNSAWMERGHMNFTSALISKFLCYYGCFCQDVRFYIAMVYNNK